MTFNTYTVPGYGVGQRLAVGGRVLTADVEGNFTSVDQITEQALATIGNIVGSGGPSGATVSTALSDYNTATWPTEQTQIAAAVASIPSTALQVHAVPASQGNYNATTNTPTWTPDAAPTNGNYCLTVTVAGTMTIGGVPTTLNVGDDIYWNGSTTTVVHGVPLSTALLKGDGGGGLVAAVPNVDYAIPSLLMQRGVPCVYLPSGTMAANGAFTTPTSVATNNGVGYFNDGVWGYCPAGAIDGANVAGWYWCVFSSTTACTIYQNRYIPGNNLVTDANSWHIPTSLTPFANAYTGTFTATGATVLTDAVTIPPNRMGRNGEIRVRAHFRETQSANAKLYQTKLGITNTAGVGTGGTAIGINLVPISNGEKYSSQLCTIVNCDRTDRQSGISSDVWASATTGGASASLDTTVAQIIGLFMTCTTADFATSVSAAYRVEYAA